MIDFKEISYTNRISIKRAIARFCYVKNIQLSEDDFYILVRRTQESGYKSAVRFLSNHFDTIGLNAYNKKQLMFQFTIEYNIEMYCKQFPEGNKTVKRILDNQRDAKDEKFFKEVLYDIVKANKIQIQIIDKYI